MVKKRNHKIFNLIIMIFISIYILGILTVSYAHEKVIDYDSSYMIADIIYGEEEEITTDYVPDENDDNNISQNPNSGKLWYRENDNNMFKEVRKNVAQWYYIFRYIGMAVMLVVLIVIGIKLALTSAAEQKAVYKRMLLDWVVCFILLYLAHYFMIFIQFLNEHLIYIFEKVSHSISGTGEYSLYETVRSRAYDIKFTVGFTGMFLYMILVYFTCKYILIYAKRFITMVILTVMAPIMLLFYAIQKIFTGKSKALSKWIGEYATNTLMQAVHAMTYAVFVGLALELSKKSLVGIIFAFICLNFMTKADTLFRQIFKFGDGSSLADENAQSKLSDIKDTAMGVYAAASVTKRTPIGRGIGKVYSKAGRAVATPALHLASGTKKLAIGIKNSKVGEAVSEKTSKIARDLSLMNAYMKDEREKRKNELYDNKIANLEQEIQNTEQLRKTQERKGILTDEQKAAFEQRIANLKSSKQNTEDRKQKHNERVKAKEDAKEARRQRRNNSARKAIFKRAAELLDPDSYLGYELDEETLEVKKNIFGKPKRKLLKSEEVYNEETEQYERIGGFRNTIKEKADAVFGLSTEDKAIIKEMNQMAKDGVLGFGAMMLGMGSFVDNPTLGFALLASGAGKIRKISKVDDNGLKVSREMKRKIRKIQREKAKTYTEPEFTTGTILSMDSIIRDLAITDPSVSRINYIKTMVESGSLRYAIPILPFILTGTKGVAVNLLLKARKGAEQNVRNIKKYEITVNVELARRLKKEILEETELVCKNVATHIMYKDITRLIMERRFKDGTLFSSSEGIMFGFNTKENCEVLTEESRIRNAIIGTALKRHIYDFKKLNLSDKYIRQELVEQLKAQGVITQADAQSEYFIKKIIDGIPGEDKSKIQSVFKDISEKSPDLLRTKLYEQTVIEYARAHDIKSVSEFSSPAVHNAIDNAYRRKLAYNHTDTDMKAVILTTALANKKSITSLSAADIITMASTANPSALADLEQALKAKSNGETLEQAIEAKQKQINGFLNDMVVGAMLNHGITNAAGLNLSSTNDPQIQSLKADLINLFNFAYKDSDGMKIDDEDLLKIMQIQINSVTKEDIEKVIIDDVYSSFIAEECGGDVSKLLNPDVKKQLTEKIVEKLSELAETEEEKSDIANVLEVLQSGKKGKQKNQAEVQESINSNNSMFTFSGNDDGEQKDEDLVADFPLPIVTTEIIGEKIYCTFEVPPGLGDEFKVESCRKTGSESKENYIESIAPIIIAKDDEIACARLVKGDKHGHSLVIKYPVDALKIVKKMEAAQNREERRRDEEKANSVDKIGMKVLDSITEISSDATLEDVIGEEQVKALNKKKADEPSVDVTFREFEIRCATNRVLDVAETIRSKKVKIAKKSDKEAVLGMIDEALGEVDELSGLHFFADTINQDAKEAYDNYKESADNLLKKLLQMKMIDEDNDKLEIKKVPEKQKAFMEIQQELETEIRSFDVNEIIGSIHQKRGV